MRTRLAHGAAAVLPPLMLVLLGLLSVEAYLRVVRFGADGVLHPMSYMSPAFKVGTCMKPGPDGELMTPNCRMRYKGAVLATNSLGFNDREVDESRPHFRVAMLGDSVTMAAGVDGRDTFHALLEDQINDELGEEDFVEFYNYGRGGRSTALELADFARSLQLWPLDAALVGVVPNDLWDNVLRAETCAPGDPDFHLSEAERRYYDDSVRGRNLLARIMINVEVRVGLWLLDQGATQVRALSRRWLADPIDAARLQAMERRGVRAFRICAQQMRRLADEAGVELAWAVLWYRPDRQAEMLHEVLLELGEPVVSMKEIADEFDSRESLVIYRNETHPSAAVHRHYAVRLRDFLQELSWIDRIREAHALRVSQGRSATEEVRR